MNKYILYIYFGFLLLFPIVLILLPSTFFDSGNTICMSVLFFNLECYGCGLTRAIQHLIHLELDQAMRFNKLSLVVFPTLIFYYIKELRRLYNIIYLN